MLSHTVGMSLIFQLQEEQSYGALEDVIRVVGVAELALILPYVTGADEIMAQGDVQQ